jgi:hypothetical protein
MVVVAVSVPVALIIIGSITIATMMGGVKNTTVNMPDAGDESGN